eukprot:GHVO01057578.1.p1 GENE.GHVO01057578.1~~GHVO01057578.1.p1  ORF type:complete len:120 (-),score=16.09 GHVO01057578.1:278-637(-)
MEITNFLQPRNTMQQGTSGGAQIRLAIGKAKGEDWSEPSGEYASMPKLFEMHSLAGAFEAKHLKWALDFDEKTNPEPNKERVERNHRAVSKMDDFQITLNKRLLAKEITAQYPRWMIFR